MRVPIITLLLALAVATTDVATAQDSATISYVLPRLDLSRTTLHPEWEQYFDSLGLDSGCIIIYDEQADHYHVFNPMRVQQGYPPASLYKIMIALEALERKAVDSSTALMKWDSLNRGGTELNKDHTLQEAFVNVSSWAFTRLALNIGKERFSRAMRNIGYGNADTVGDPFRYWLIGRLKVSALGAIQFSKKLADRQLPGYSERTQRIVRDMMFRRDTLGVAVWRKTGLGWIGDMQIGRLQGWAEKDGRRWFFGVNFQTSDPHFPTRSARRYIYISAMQSLGILPKGWDE